MSSSELAPLSTLGLEPGRFALRVEGDLHATLAGDAGLELCPDGRVLIRLQSVDSGDFMIVHRSFGSLPTIGDCDLWGDDCGEHDGKPNPAAFRMHAAGGAVRGGEPAWTVSASRGVLTITSVESDGLAATFSAMGCGERLDGENELRITLTGWFHAMSTNQGVLGHCVSGAGERVKS